MRVKEGKIFNVEVEEGIGRRNMEKKKREIFWCEGMKRLSCCKKRKYEC